VQCCILSIFISLFGLQVGALTELAKQEEEREREEAAVAEEGGSHRPQSGPLQRVGSGKGGSTIPTGDASPRSPRSSVEATAKVGKTAAVQVSQVRSG
jgi:hypothetical protein